MRRNRHHLYLSTSIARCSPLRKAPEGEEGGTGNESNAGGDNKSVNQDSGTGGGEANAGQQFDYSSFWAQPAEEGQNKESQGNEADAGKELGQQLVSQIQGFKPEEVFTPAALQKMAEGDLTDLNTGITKSFQAGMTQMLGITAKLMQAFEGHFEKRFESLMSEKIEGSRTTERDEQLLSKEFKGFSNPATRPLIQGVFNQSLTHTKGDRDKALKLTRDMLQQMGQHGKDDLGFSSFRNPDDNLDEGPSRLVQELLELRK